MAVCTCNMAVFLSQCARSSKLLPTDRVSRDVPYLLQCLKRCAVPLAVPQEMCRTSCSASRDVPYLLQCRVVPRDTSLRSAPTSLTVGAFRVCSSQLTVLTTWWSCSVTASPSVSPNSSTRLIQIFDACWLGSCGRRWCSAV